MAIYGMLNVLIILCRDLEVCLSRKILIITSSYINSDAFIGYYNLLSWKRKEGGAMA